MISELGVEPVHLSTIKRCLKRCAARDYRDLLAEACFTHVSTRDGGDVSLLLYDVTVRHEALAARTGVRDLCRGFLP